MDKRSYWRCPLCNRKVTPATGTNVWCSKGHQAIKMFKAYPLSAYPSTTQA